MLCARVIMYSGKGLPNRSQSALAQWARVWTSMFMVLILFSVCLIFLLLAVSWSVLDFK